MKQYIPMKMTALVLGIGMMTISDSHSLPVYVENNNDTGTDSFRWAVNELQTKPYVSEIVIKSHVGPIDLKSTVAYSSATKKFILSAEEGSTAKIRESEPGEFALLEATSSDVEIDRIHFRNGFGLSLLMSGNGIDENVELSNIVVESSEGRGVRINSTSVKTLIVEIDSPHIFKNKSHGIDIVKENGDTDVKLWKGKFEDNMEEDFASFVVTSTENGSIYFECWNTTFTNAGEDAIELEEKGAGDVLAYVHDMTIGGNIGEDGINLQEEMKATWWAQ